MICLICLEQVDLNLNETDFNYLLAVHTVEQSTRDSEPSWSCCGNWILLATPDKNFAIPANMFPQLPEKYGGTGYSYLFKIKYYDQINPRVINRTLKKIWNTIY